MVRIDLHGLEVIPNLRYCNQIPQFQEPHRAWTCKSPPQSHNSPRSIQKQFRYLQSELSRTERLEQQLHAPLHPCNKFVNIDKLCVPPPAD